MICNFIRRCCYVLFVCAPLVPSTNAQIAPGVGHRVTLKIGHQPTQSAQLDAATSAIFKIEEESKAFESLPGQSSETQTFHLDLIEPGDTKYTIDSATIPR